MKKLFLSLLIFVLPALALAQTIDLAKIVPDDPEVRVGRLDNGAMYYIRHNAKDPQRANFHILYKVGAIQEEDNQDGLAHFLEHMAFNGSMNFQGNSLIDYLQSIGVRFGENLNAGTGQEMTTYMITNVPVTRQGIIDSALLVLHDWAGFISLQEKDIDEERGVIGEEWRLGNNADRRVMEKQFPVIFNNSIYSKRTVIGDPEIIKNFKYNELRDFYHKWYRPDLMAFIIVGDIGVDEVERRLKEVMADVRPFEVRTPLAEIVIEDNDRPLISIVTDPELTHTENDIIFRHKPLAYEKRNTLMAFRNNLKYSLISDMFNQRLDELAKKENAPFLQTFGSYFPFVRPFDAFYVSSTAKDGESLKAFEATYTELLRMQRNGFTASELERAKTSILRGAQSELENRNDRRNNQFVTSYTKNFFRNEPFPTPEKNLELTALLLEDISLEDVNTTATALVRDKNVAITIAGPEKEEAPVPSETELLAAMDKVKASDIKPYVDEVTNRPLINKELVGSKVAATGEGRFGSTVWTLENGVKVILKPTDFKADEIVLNAFQKGGLSTIDDIGDLYSVNLYSRFEDMAGVGDFSAVQLTKLLAGKIVWVSPRFGDNTQGFSGGCSPKDFETLMQLTYLYYTEPRFERADYNVLINQIEAVLPNMANDPFYIMQDSTMRTLYGNNPRRAVMSREMIDRVSLEKMESAYRKLFSNAYDMTFVLVGNFDRDSLRPYVEKYLGSLPAARFTPAWTDNIPQLVPGKHENIFTTKQETPKVSAIRAYSGSTDYSLQRKVEVDAIRHILNVRYTKSIREEAGGTYGVGVNMSLSLLPKPSFGCIVSFDTNDEKINELLPIVQKEIDDMMKDGPSLENLNIAKEFFLKKFKENNIANGTWSGYITSWQLYGNDHYTKYTDAVNALTVESVRDAARELFSQGNVATVIQKPE